MRFMIPNDYWLDRAPIWVYEETKDSFRSYSGRSTTHWQGGAHTDRLPHISRFHLVYPALDQVTVGRSVDQVCCISGLVVLVCRLGLVFLVEFSKELRRPG